MDLELNNKFDDLDRAMQIAAKCRFKASRRQRRHKQIAQGTIALLSLELIIVPTLVLGGLKTGFSPGMTAAVQICAAVFVLVFSLLIGTVFGVSAHQSRRDEAEMLRWLKAAGVEIAPGAENLVIQYLIDQTVRLQKGAQSVGFVFVRFYP